jgi:hypothetical protein
MAGVFAPFLTENRPPRAESGLRAATGSAQSCATPLMLTVKAAVRPPLQNIIAKAGDLLN